MAPLLASATAEMAMPSLAWPWRATMLLAGVGGTGLAAWFIGRRALGTLGDAYDMLHALREGDYGMRARLRPGYDPLQPLLADINDVSDALQRLRRKGTESARFLAKSLAALGDPVFVIDDGGRIVLANAAARSLVGSDAATVIGRDLASLAIAEPLSVADGTILSWHFANASGRWAVRRAAWYSEGRENTLVMLHNLSAALGDEERHAWQRLIRVLNHELNNSLTPIGSLATSLHDLLDTHEVAPLKPELRMGLEVIARRSSGLARFLAGYGHLARLPPPRLQAVRIDLALQRLALLEKRLTVDVRGSAPLTVLGDGDQLDQAFINLLRNAVDAALPGGGTVRVDWRREGNRVLIQIEDEGCGLPPSDTLFVPFFTTKPDGSGIGLSLTRLIVHAHAGTVDLENRNDAPGAVATIRLPVVP